MASRGRMLAKLGDVAELDFGLVMDGLDVGIVVLDRQGCVVAWNDWMARTTRRSKASVQGQTLLDIYPTLRDTRIPAAIEDAFQAGSASILTHSLNRLLPL